jgi:hypothetical protein
MLCGGWTAASSAPPNPLAPSVLYIVINGIGATRLKVLCATRARACSGDTRFSPCGIGWIASTALHPNHPVIKRGHHLLPGLNGKEIRFRPFTTNELLK